MPRYEIMKPKHSDYYVGEPLYYSREWYSPKGAAGDIITTDSEPYIEKLKPKTIYVPHKKKSAYVRYSSPRIVRKEPLKIIHGGPNAVYPVIHECKPHTIKHLKPIEVIKPCPYLRHHHSGTTFIDDTSVDDEHSLSQYSNLSLDVSCDVSAINRDVEALLQQYERVFDDTLNSEYEKRTVNVNNRKLKQEKLTSEQMKILSMEKPPLEKLKDIPVQYLKPRLPPSLKERKNLPPTVEAKKVTEIENNEINTDDLLKELFQDMASKGLTGAAMNEEEDVAQKTENIKTITNEINSSNSNNSTIGTQTINNESNSSIKKIQSIMEQRKHNSQKSVNKSETNKQELNKSNHTKYPNLTNLEDFLEESIKFDMNINTNQEIIDNFTHVCPNCNNQSNIIGGSGDTSYEKSPQVNGINLMESEINEMTKIKSNFTDNINREKKMEDDSGKNNESQLTSLRECLSDLTHSRKQDKLEYNSKNNKLSYKWQNKQLQLNNDKTVSPSKKSSQSSISCLTLPYSGYDTVTIESKDALQYQTLNDKASSEHYPHSKNVFGISSSLARTNRLCSSLAKTDLIVNTVSCEPLGGGDVDVENEKKIMTFLDEFCSAKSKLGELTAIDSLGEKMAQLDSSSCVEIMRRLTDLLIKHQPNSVSSPNVNRSVHLNILKQLRTDHLRHIQQEIKHIEDLDEFLQNFGLSAQLVHHKDKQCPSDGSRHNEG